MNIAQFASDERQSYKVACKYHNVVGAFRYSLFIVRGLLAHICFLRCAFGGGSCFSFDAVWSYICWKMAIYAITTVYNVT